MAKNKRNDQGAFAALSEAPVEAAPVIPDSQPSEPLAPVPPSNPQEPALVEGKITFEMYCRRKGIHERRHAGMRAFTKLTCATYEEWESAFKNY